MWKCFFVFYVYRYLDIDYYCYCVLSNFFSGLGSFLLDYVWVDGKENIFWLIIKMFFFGDVLDGKKVYEMIMLYFIIIELKFDEVYKLGYE